VHPPPTQKWPQLPPELELLDEPLLLEWPLLLPEPLFPLDEPPPELDPPPPLLPPPLLPLLLVPSPLDELQAPRARERRKTTGVGMLDMGSSWRVTPGRPALARLHDAARRRS